MARGRKTYPKEFKVRVIEMARAGRSAESLARDFEPTAQTIRNWVKQADLDEGRRSDGLTSVERDELGRLRREITPITPASHRRTPKMSLERGSVEVPSWVGMAILALVGCSGRWATVREFGSADFDLLMEALQRYDLEAALANPTCPQSCLHGSLNTSVVSGRTVTTDLGGSDVDRAGAVQTDGNFLVAGISESTPSNQVLSYVSTE